MDFKQIAGRALEIRNKYALLEKKKYGREWTREEIAQALVGDVGDLMKIIMAKSKIREMDDPDEKLAHELADCLWNILVLAGKYDIDLEKSFLDTMQDLEKRIEEKL